MKIDSNSTEEEINAEIARRTDEKMKGIAYASPADEGAVASGWNNYFRERIRAEISASNFNK